MKNTIQLDQVKTIQSFDNVYDLMEELSDETFSRLNEEELSELRGLDDFEFFRYTVINSETVIVSDDYLVIGIYSLDEFNKETQAAIADRIERSI